MPSDNTLHGGYEYYSYGHEWKIDECIVSLIKGIVDMPMGIEKIPQWQTIIKPTAPAPTAKSSNHTFLRILRAPFVHFFYNIRVFCKPNYLCEQCVRGVWCQGQIHFCSITVESMFEKLPNSATTDELYN